MARDRVIDESLAQVGEGDACGFRCIWEK